MKQIVLLLLTVFAIMQLFRIDKTNPEVVIENDFITTTSAPQEIATILKTTCYDCHSNETKYPWYSNVAPVSWWLKDHINEGREELNFSNWAKFSVKRKKHKIKEALKELESGDMPLDEYTWTHGDARLSAEQKAQLMDWLKSLQIN